MQKSYKTDNRYFYVKANKIENCDNSIVTLSFDLKFEILNVFVHSTTIHVIDHLFMII